MFSFCIYIFKFYFIFYHAIFYVLVVIWVLFHFAGAGDKVAKNDATDALYYDDNDKKCIMFNMYIYINT